MANALCLASCRRCLHYSVKGDVAHCQKQNFNFPKLIFGYETLCKDYCWDTDFSDRACCDAGELPGGYLYYYASQGRRYFAPLGRFNELTHTIYAVRLLDDDVHGWLFEVRDSYTQDLGLKEEIIIKYQDASAKFTQKEITKKMMISLSLNEGAEHKNKVIRAFLRKISSEDVLGTFIDNTIGIQLYRKKMNMSPVLSFPGVGAFLVQIDDLVYELKEDLQFREFWLKEGTA